MRHSVYMPPPLMPIIALPLAWAALATSALCPSLIADSRLDKDTVIPIGVAIVGMIVIIKFVWWYAQDCKATRDRQKAQADMLRFLFDRLPEIDTKNDWQAKRLLMELDSAMGEGGDKKQRKGRS